MTKKELNNLSKNIDKIKALGVCIGHPDLLPAKRLLNLINQNDNCIDATLLLEKSG